MDTAANTYRPLGIREIHLLREVLRAAWADLGAGKGRGTNWLSCRWLERVDSLIIIIIIIIIVN